MYWLVWSDLIWAQHSALFKDPLVPFWGNIVTSYTPFRGELKGICFQCWFIYKYRERVSSERTRDRYHQWVICCYYWALGDERYLWALSPEEATWPDVISGGHFIHLFAVTIEWIQAVRSPPDFVFSWQLLFRSCKVKGPEHSVDLTFLSSSFPPVRSSSLCPQVHWGFTS